MQTFKPNRREFLQVTVGSLVTVATPTYLLAAQTEPIRGFQSLREYAIKLYEEIVAYNRREDKRAIAERDDNPNFRIPYLFQGKISGRRTLIHVHKDLSSGLYSLETKTYFNREDIQLGGDPSSDRFSEDLLRFASNVFLDKGIKGNLQGRTDIVTAVSIDPKAVEYSMFTGDGGYYFAHLLTPRVINEEQGAQEKVKILVSNLGGQLFSSHERLDLLSILTSFDGYPSTAIFDMLWFIDGVAWYSPSGIVRSYLDLSLGNRRGVNVGTQPSLIGSYSGSSHAELQRRREDAFGNANSENTRIMQRTLDTLVEEGKIILPQNL